MIHHIMAVHRNSQNKNNSLNNSIGSSGRTKTFDTLRYILFSTYLSFNQIDLVRLERYLDFILNFFQCSFFLFLKLYFRETLVNYMSENHKVIPHSIFRKYIAYARQYVRPRLSDAAAKVLQNFYLDLRKKNQDIANIPIFNRQLEALIRLTMVSNSITNRSICL